MKSEEFYRDACRKQHRLLGHYLAIQSWLGKVECVVLERNHLASFLGLQKFKAIRVEWLMEDLKPWFPYQEPYYRADSESSIRTLFLSRVPISDHLPSGIMMTPKRLTQMATDSPPTAILYELIGKDRKLSVDTIIAYLGMLSAGLINPSADVELQVSEMPKIETERLHGSQRIKQDFEEELTDALSNIILGEKLPLDVFNAKTGEILIHANKKVTRTLIKKVVRNHQHIKINPSPIQIRIEGAISACVSKHDRD